MSRCEQYSRLYCRGSTPKYRTTSPRYCDETVPEMYSKLLHWCLGMQDICQSCLSTPPMKGTTETWHSATAQQHLRASKMKMQRNLSSKDLYAPICCWFRILSPSSTSVIASISQGLIPQSAIRLVHRISDDTKQRLRLEASMFLSRGWSVVPLLARTDALAQECWRLDVNSRLHYFSTTGFADILALTKTCEERHCIISKAHFWINITHESYCQNTRLFWPLQGLFQSFIPRALVRRHK